jgi:8-oxo-dGTP pyrophosphatase MutT (NUDIX family)
MPYTGSYLWKLRQAVGSELVLMPGAMVALRRDDGAILLTQRADDGHWCLPAGAAEPGGSFARTAIEELREETGVEVAEEDLVPFGCLSEAESTRSAIRTATSPTVLLSASWRKSGGVIPGPTTKSRPRLCSSGSTISRSQSTHPRSARWSY